MKKATLGLIIWVTGLLFVFGCICVMECNAQEYQIEREQLLPLPAPNTDQDICPIPDGVLCEIIPKDRIFKLHDLVDYWKAYKTECYADSHEESGWKFVITDTTSYGVVAGYDQYSTWWVYKQPTFDGFMDFLESEVEK